ncbi:hypothetical protein ACN469_20240 [Corallococcus terminator]
MGESTARVHNISSIARRLFIMEASARGFRALVDSGEQIKFGVTGSGQRLVAPHTYLGAEIKHAVLSGGRAVPTAGEAQIARAGRTYFGLRINGRSGHFMPTEESVAYARAAFARIGITFPQPK